MSEALDRVRRMQTETYLQVYGQSWGSAQARDLYHADLVEVSRLAMDAEDRIAEMEEKVKRANELHQQWLDTHKACMDESCDGVEKHCTCIGTLRESVRRLEAKLANAEAKLQDSPSETILRHYKQAAHDIGDLFCWCVENLYLFPPAPGEKPWLEGIKDRLKAGHAADQRIIHELKAMKSRADAAEAKLQALSNLAKEHQRWAEATDLRRCYCEMCKILRGPKEGVTNG